MDGLLKATRHVLAVASTLVLALGLSHLVIRSPATVPRAPAEVPGAPISRPQRSAPSTPQNRQSAPEADFTAAGTRTSARHPAPGTSSQTRDPRRRAESHAPTAPLRAARAGSGTHQPSDPHRLEHRTAPAGTSEPENGSTDATTTPDAATRTAAAAVADRAPEPSGSSNGSQSQPPQVRAERRVVFRPLPATEPTAPLRVASDHAERSPAAAGRPAAVRDPVPPPEALQTPPLPAGSPTPPAPSLARPPSSEGQTAARSRQIPDPLELRLAQLERQLRVISERLPDRRRATDELRSRLQHLEHLAQLDQLQKQIERLLERRNRAAQDPESGGENGRERSAPSQPPAGDEKPAGDAHRVVTTVPQDGDAFTIHTAAETPLGDVLQQLSELAGTNILPSPEAQKLRVTLHLKNVTLQQALNVLAENYGLDIVPRDDFIFVRTQQEAEQTRENQRKIVTRVFRLNYISAQDVQQIVQPLITEKVGRITTTTPAQVGIQQDETNAGGNALAQLDTIVVMDYEDIVEEIAKVIAELDKPPLQIVIEAKILSVQLNDSLKYGINFALLSGSGDDLFIGGNGLELRNSSGIPALAISPSISPSGSFVSDIGGLKYGLIRGDASLFIRAVEQISDASLIAAPQLRVLNKQRAELLIGQRIAYKTLTFNGTQTVENVNFLDVGTRLILRPFASEDGLVRLEIHPKKSSGTVTDGLPEERTTQVTTNVMVREGTTVVIGGLIEEQVTDNDDRIPLVGSLPGIGALFRNKEEAVTRNELIVLLTPRIVREPEAVLEGEEFNEEHERRQESFRNSLTPFNRRNLARFETERAQHYYDSGNLLKARIHIQKALKYSPNDPHARRLRDRIEADLGQRFRNLLSWPSGLKRHPTRWPGEATEPTTSPHADASNASAEPSAPQPLPGFSLDVSPGGAPQQHGAPARRPADPRPAEPQSATAPNPTTPNLRTEPPAPAPPASTLPVRPQGNPGSIRTSPKPPEKTAAQDTLRRMSFDAAADDPHGRPRSEAPTAPHAPAHGPGNAVADRLRELAPPFPPSVLRARTIAPSLLVPTVPAPPALSELTPTLPLPVVPKDARATPPAVSPPRHPQAGNVRRVKRGGRGLR